MRIRDTCNSKGGAYGLEKGINDLETKAYCLADFILCCMNEPQKVQALYEAELNARIQFGINTKSELIAFIGNQGLQNLTYVDTELWRNNPRKNEDIYIDAYKFCSNHKKGYIAFMKGAVCKYVIKSFHLDYDKLTTKDLGTYSTKLLKEGI